MAEQGEALDTRNQAAHPMRRSTQDACLYFCLDDAPKGAAAETGIRISSKLGAPCTPVFPSHPHSFHKTDSR